MGKKDKRITDYISAASPFAQKIMKHFRMLVHSVCPDAEERMRWSFPHFDHRGQMMCSMAAFKQHCAVGFRKASSLSGAELLLANARSETAMGHLGRITSLKDLPKDAVLKKWIREAMKLNEQGMKADQKKRTSADRTLEVPRYFELAVRKNKKAKKVFDEFSYSNKKDYVQWVTDAKAEETRKKRLATAVEWMSEGKTGNWKYIKK